MNKASLDRGFGRCILMRKYTTMVRRYPNQTYDRIVAPAQLDAGAPAHLVSRYACGAIIPPLCIPSLLALVKQIASS